MGRGILAFSIMRLTDAVCSGLNSGCQVGPMETTPKARKKGQPREMNLTAQCLICNGPAAAHQVSLCFLFEEDLYA